VLLARPNVSRDRQRRGSPAPPGNVGRMDGRGPYALTSSQAIRRTAGGGASCSRTGRGRRPLALRRPSRAVPIARRALERRTTMRAGCPRALHAVRVGVDAAVDHVSRRRRRPRSPRPIRYAASRQPTLASDGAEAARTTSAFKSCADRAACFGPISSRQRREEAGGRRAAAVPREAEREPRRIAAAGTASRQHEPAPPLCAASARRVPAWRPRRWSASALLMQNHHRASVTSPAS